MFEGMLMLKAVALSLSGSEVSPWWLSPAASVASASTTKLKKRPHVCWFLDSGITIGTFTSKRPSSSVTSVSVFKVLSASLPERHHHKARRRTTLYFTFAPCTGTPAKLFTWPTTVTVSLFWYFAVTSSNSTWNVGRLYSSTEK